MADDFFTKQLPFNVTWGLTLLYAMDHQSNFSDPAVQVGRPHARQAWQAPAWLCARTCMAPAGSCLPRGNAGSSIHDLDH